MTSLYTNKISILNLHKKMSSKSEVLTQMIYGDSFTIINKKKKWLKIKIKEDNYIGYIKTNKCLRYTKPTHKVHTLFANLYKNPNKNKRIGRLTFASKIKVGKKIKKFAKFENNWIEIKNIKPIKFKQKKIFSNIRIFKKTKYKWGGKSYKGLDCSALIQLFFNFNNRFCPRDAKDQIKYFKKNVNLKSIKKDDIIYWKGHVAVSISEKKLIHAYGPMKKTVEMDTARTIDLIKKTANLSVLSIKRI